MRRIAVIAAFFVFVPAAQAATQLGIFGSIDRFHQLTGQQSQVGHVIVGWGQSTFSQIWPTLGPTPMLGFGSGGGQGVITCNRWPAGKATNTCLR
jgi:hypothetical protein